MEVKKPLPGLVKVFLLNLYVLAAFCVIILYLGLMYRYIHAGVIALAPCISLLLAVIAIGNIHGRSAAAPGICSFINFVILIMIAVGLAILGSGESWYFYGQSGIYMVIGMACALIPQLIAWIIYFRGSEKVAVAFGINREPRALPPLGIGLLRIFCWSYVTGTTGFFIFLFLNQPEVAKGIGFTWLPNVILCLLLLRLAYLRGVKVQSLVRLLGTWLVIHAVTTGFSIRFTVWKTYFPRIFEGDLMEAVVLAQYMDGIPVAPGAFVVLIAALCWRFATNADEGQWVSQDPSRVAALGLDRAPLFAVVLFFVAYVGYRDGALQLITAGRTFDTVAFLRAAGGLGVSLLAFLAGIHYLRGQGGEGRLGLRGPFAFGLIYFVALVVLDMVRGQWAGSPVYVFYRYGGLLTACIFGLMAASANVAPGRASLERAERSFIHSLFAMPVPAACFVLVCLGMLCSMALGKLGVHGMTVIFGPPKSLVGSLKFAGMLPEACYWIGWLICPILAVLMVTRGLASRGHFYAVCIAWTLTVLFRDVAVSTGPSYVTTRDVATTVTAIALFAGYCDSSKQLAEWRAWKARKKALKPQV